VQDCLLAFGPLGCGSLIHVLYSFLVSAICVGTFVMAAAIIPMGMQGTEETQGLDAACMATVWMTFLGFVIALSALFSKTWRMNQVMQSGIGMRRIEVQAKDVLGPFFGLMTVNITLLTLWTTFFPLSYIRFEGNDYDSYGRSLESYGQCMTRDGNKNFLYFLVPLLVFDFVGVAVAFYQSYLARTLPTEFSESYYLALSMGCLTETLVLGGPILFAANTSSPAAFFLVLSLLVITTSLAILLPIFVPKYLHRNAQRNNVLRTTIQSRRSIQPGESNPDSRSPEPRRPAGYMSLKRLNSGSRSSGSAPRGRVSFMHPASTSFCNDTQRHESNGSWGGIHISGVSGLQSTSCLVSIKEADGSE
jgi:7 transmembrane sweet-taste receptor of 3 GCPR